MSSKETAAISTRQAVSSKRNYPTNEEIAARAYQLFLSRGGSDGLDKEDWLEAEKELKERN